MESQQRYIQADYAVMLVQTVGKISTTESSGNLEGSKKIRDKKYIDYYCDSFKFCMINCL